MRGLEHAAVMPSHHAMEVDIPIEQLNHMRTVVCTETGHHLTSTNIPQSVIPRMYVENHPLAWQLKTNEDAVQAALAYTG